MGVRVGARVRVRVRVAPAATEEHGEGEAGGPRHGQLRRLACSGVGVGVGVRVGVGVGVGVGLAHLEESEVGQWQRHARPAAELRGAVHMLPWLHAPGRGGWGAVRRVGSGEEGGER